MGKTSTIIIYKIIIITSFNTKFPKVIKISTKGNLYDWSAYSF